MDRLDRVKRIADTEAGDGLIYLHPDGGSRATHVVMTLSRYNRLCERIWPENTIPAGDEEWAHEHILEREHLSLRGRLQDLFVVALWRVRKTLGR